MDLLDRLSSKIKIDPDSGCWLWTATRGPSDKFQYGQIRVGGRQGRVLTAHRVMYELVVGPVDDSLVLDHLCRNTLCVNPAHVEPVTQQINVLRGVGNAAQNAAKTHCAHGHELSGSNLRILYNGKRCCRACRSKYDRNHYARKVEGTVRRAYRRREAG